MISPTTVSSVRVRSRPPTYVYKSSEKIDRAVVHETASSSPPTFFQKYEISRKLFHSGTGLFTVWLYASGYNQRQLVVPLAVMATMCFAQEFIRFRNPQFNQWFQKTYGFMMRDSEKSQYNGILFFLVGVILTSAFLPKDLAVMCNFFLSWADTSALFFGRMFGRYTPKVSANKSIAGCLASFAVGVFSCYLVYAVLVPQFGPEVDKPHDIMYSVSTSRLNLHVYALLCGTIASFSECVDFYKLDDNFTIPVISGVSLYALVWFFQ